MAWVTFSQGKMTAKSRIQQLNSRLSKITYQLSNQQRVGAYKIEMLNSNKNAIMDNLDSRYNSQMTYLQNQAQNASKDKDKEKINNQITEYQQAYQSQKEYYESYFTRLQETQQQQNERKENALTMEKEQIQTQLTNWQEQYKAYQSACESNIKEDAPKFV